MENGEAILIISHTFPPYKGIGGRRWVKFAKSLARRGHPVHVIHSAGPEELKGSLWTADSEVPGIHRHPLPQRYPTVLFKRPLTSFGQRIAYQVWSKLLPLLVKGNYFDKAVFWEAQLLRKASELIALHTIRHVIVTGAPFRLMAHAAKLKKQHPELRLVADLRDPWTWSHGYGHGTLGSEREAYERGLEASVMRTFDKVISPAPAMITHLMSTYQGSPDRFIHIPHAIDPDDLGPVQEPLNDGRFRMIYAGSLYGATEAEAYFETLLNAFQRCRALEPFAFANCQFDLFITGHGVDMYRGKVQAAGLDKVIVFHSPLPARELFPRIALADLVIIFIPTGNKDLLGTKFNEIFHLRRPVLHVGEPGLVSRTIIEKRLGTSLQVKDLEVALPKIISGEQRVTVDPSVDMSEVELDRVTERLLREVLA